MGSFPTQYRHTGKVAVDFTQSSGTFSGGAGGPASVGKAVVQEGDFTKTEYIFDITGMASVAVENDVIGGTGVAYVLKLDAVTGTDVKFAELVCLEAPETGEIDINLTANASGTLEGGDAAGTEVVVDAGGDWTVGSSKAGAGADLSAKPYLYLTVGTGTTPAADTYTKGIYRLTVYTTA